MYLKHFHLNQSPFAEEPDPNIFFPDANRDQILKGLKKDLQAGTPLIRITGPEGSGKTMLCRLLLLDLPADDFEVIYIDNPVGSFDDLLHVVCLDLGMEPATEPVPDMLSELRLLLDQNREQQKKVVLIVDEAEKLFLAALERLMQIICEVGDTHVLHVILASRPDLDEHLDQLGVYCSDVDIKANYILEPFNEQEINNYLNFRLTAVGLPADIEQEVFSDGAVHKIFESAMGNLRLVNILAEEALQASSADKSFLVLLDHVVEQDDHSTKQPDKRVGLNKPHKLGKLFTGVGIIAALLLLIFLYNGDKDTEETDPVAEPEPTVLTTPIATTPEPEVKNELLPESVVTTSSEKVQAEAVDKQDEPTSEPLTTAVDPSEQELPEISEQDEPAEETPATAIPEQPQTETAEQDPPEQITPEAQVSEQSPSKPVESTPETPVIASTEEKATAIPAEEAQPSSPEQELEAVSLSQSAKTVNLTPGMKKTKPTVSEAPSAPAEDDETLLAESLIAEPGQEQEQETPAASATVYEFTDGSKSRPQDYSETEATTVESTDDTISAAELEVEEKSETEPETSAEQVTAATPDADNRKKEQVYQQLVSIGDRWKTGIHQDQFTIQMIALTSQDAVPNLKSMLIREEYLTLKTKLYILRKPTAPPTIYVFYGIYDTMEQARTARNNMPLFLRKHHPYALPIADALKKSEY